MCSFPPKGDRSAGWGGRSRKRGTDHPVRFEARKQMPLSRVGSLKANKPRTGLEFLQVALSGSATLEGRVWGLWSMVGGACPCHFTQEEVPKALWKPRREVLSGSQASRCPGCTHLFALPNPVLTCLLVSQIPASFYSRNCSSFSPYLCFTVNLQLEKKAISVEWEVPSAAFKLSNPEGLSSQKLREFCSLCS